jgi:hypothetical protein
MPRWKRRGIFLAYLAIYTCRKSLLRFACFSSSDHRSLQQLLVKLNQRQFPLLLLAGGFQ